MGKQTLPRWRGVQSLMGGFEGADNGKVAHDDDKEGEEDDADDQDRGREDGAGSW